MKKTLPALVALAAVLPFAGSAEADIRTGRLLCNVAPGTGWVVISEKVLNCRYDAIDGRREFYQGTISKFGVDLGATTGGSLVWAVFEPALRPGSLTGAYGGGSAEVTLGVGLGANALVGGGDGGVTLQPVSVNAQSGLNVAAGIGAMSLRQVAPPEGEPVYYRHHRRHYHKG
ncbi:MAG: DUF992 domain-containing protein [Beijerinckiaceae bacterium]|nr:DUF992 domain-containing protein [Beijerinckiaceae bacterium]